MSRQTQYFSKFPIINYDNQNLINIMLRVRFPDNLVKFSKLFYDLTLRDGERIEHVAYNLYEDTDLQWVLNLANKVVDPYYHYSLSDRNFKAFIDKKYGSVEAALKKVLYYRNDWSTDDSILTQVAFDALTEGRRKYWDPIQQVSENPSSRGSTYVTTGYTRRKADFIHNTNKIESFVFDTDGNNNFLLQDNAQYSTFEVGEKIRAANTEFKGSDTYAFVTFANTSYVSFQHIFGDFSANTSYDLIGETSGVIATVDQDSHLITNVIPQDEQVYFKPVYVYDYEDELNSQKKEIKIVVDEIAQQLNEELSELV